MAPAGIRPRPGTNARPAPSPPRTPRRPAARGGRRPRLPRKSTLVNALIGERLTPTGTLELSFSVNHLRYGTDPGLTVHFTDPTRPPLPTSLADLEKFAARREDNADLLRSIEYLDVVSDRPYLAGFDLIDTAGLDSPWIEDSAKTLDFLKKSRDQVAAATLEATTSADALLVVMGRGGQSQTDDEMLRAFLGPRTGAASPVTTIGVLTKVEEMWRDHPDPFVGARMLRDDMFRSPAVRAVLFEIQPVCGRLAETAAGLDEADLEDIRTLAKVSAEDLERSVKSAAVFQRTDRGLPLDPARRDALRGRFTPFGLMTACCLIRDGVGTVDELRTRLEEVSGIRVLRDRLTDHFAHRSHLIKARITGEALRRQARGLRAGLTAPDAEALDTALETVETALRDEPGLDELDLLQRLVSGELRLGPDDREDVLHLVGEYGRSAAARLRLADTAAPADLAARARDLHDRWLGHLNAGRYRGSAHVVVARCANLLRAVAAARALLEDPDSADSRRRLR
ncbi:dynamin family protein [Catenulispora yoronensis]